MPIEGGPLSLCKMSGTPCLENIASSFGTTALADVEVSSSTQGRRLISSTATIM